jgi:HEAT repeat protein
MVTAILTALNNRGGEMLAELLREPAELDNAKGLLEPLCAAIAARRDKNELSAALVRIDSVGDRSVRLTCLRGIRKSFNAAGDVPLSDEARDIVRAATISSDFEIASLARDLFRLMRLEKPAERAARIALAMDQLQDVTSRPETRVLAIAELSAEDGPAIGPALVAALPSATPRVREALLDAVFRRRERLVALLDGIEHEIVAPVMLSAVQRNQLLTDKDEAVRSRAARLLTVANVDSLAAFPRFAAALREPRDVAHGQQVFRETCGKCHQAHGIGFAVGPDLSSEFQRAEETIIKDILAPVKRFRPAT